MKTATRFALLFAVVSMFPTWAQESSPFTNFRGDYLRQGIVEISDVANPVTGRKIKMRFKIATTGDRARLRITGSVNLNGAIRPFSALYIFKSTGATAFSNLAPAIDDGHAAEGTYSVLPRKITAEAPFTIGTTTGKGTLELRLRKRPRGLQLLAVQTLSTDALLKPIHWTFKAFSPR